MPIAPHFELSQTPSHVVVSIRVPHVRVSADSVRVVLLPSESEEEQTDGEGNDGEEHTGITSSVLHFASPPYLLVLHFGLEHQFHPLAEEACASYEPTIRDGTITLRLQKAVEGQHWDDLDLLGNLVPKRNKQKKNTSRWLKEVVAATEEGEGERQQAVGVVEDSNAEDEDDDGGLSHPHHQQEGEEFDEDSTTNGGYGFLRMFGGVFADLIRGDDDGDAIAKEMFEMPWDDDAPAAATTGVGGTDPKILRRRRRRDREALEEGKFDPDRYLQDLESLEEDYVYQCAVAMKPHWQQNQHGQQQGGGGGNKEEDGDEEERTSSSSSSSSSTFFTPDERLRLASKPYPLLPPQPPQSSGGAATIVDGLLPGLLDLLFAYAYDHLITDGDPTVESAWTISVLSAGLSWLDDWLDDDNNDDELEMDENLRDSTDGGPVVVESEPSSQHQQEASSALRSSSSSSSSVTAAVVRSSIRRSLVYPYIRNVDFAALVWRHVAAILRHPGSNTRCVLRCLLQTRGILDRSELYYLGNKLLVDPYLAWIQQYSTQLGLDEALERLAGEIEKEVSTDNCEHLKSQLNLDLPRIEASMFASEEEEEEDESSSDSSSSSTSGSDGDTDDDDDDDGSRESEEPAHDAQTSKTEKVYSSELLDVQEGLSTLILAPSSSNTSNGGGRSPCSPGRRGLIEELE